ncbi:twin-arginine translocation signal domain-containing protein [uncultured Cocleimonas sp.]|uniref:twin-arginine translocation signal domain-containing protein n=1 Tax=uncultured Cocleimonas sp. TaxID=1051587 RepID=UPI0026159AF2|nr:twin-arginine translocation signal domain-containing protein [uncultured Cocleimonas sp.]
MTNKTFTKSRRNFLKGAACTSALSLGGLSGLAFAAKATASEQALGAKTSADLVNSSISIMQQKTLTGETVTLINQSDKIVMLDALKPVSLEQYNGSLIVRVNQIESEAFNGMIAVSPSERISFDIKSLDFNNSYAGALQSSHTDQNHVNISSEHSIFNRVVPVQMA